MARISGFHPEGSGSIPGTGESFLPSLAMVNFTYRDVIFYSSAVPYCLVVRISGSHPEGPGSIPGMGDYNFNSGNIKCYLCLKLLP